MILSDEHEALFQVDFKHVESDIAGEFGEDDYRHLWLCGFNAGFNEGYSAADSHGQDLARYAAEAEHEKAYLEGVEDERNRDD